MAVSTAAPADANEFIEQQLDTRITRLEQQFNADAIGFSGPLIAGTDDLFREAIEEKHKNGIKEKAVIILTTPGGYIEVVHRIVDTLRHHYKVVEIVVPNSAFSAGTVLAMSGDAIHMDYYSRPGPIDPQIETESGRGEMVGLHRDTVRVPLESTGMVHGTCADRLSFKLR